MLRTTRHVMPLAAVLTVLSVAPWAVAQKPPASASAKVAAPKPPTTPLQIGLEALDKSKYADAERELTTASRGADRAAALVGLSRLYRITGKLKESIEAADKALQTRGKPRFEAAASKAQSLAAQGKLTEAIAAAESVKEEGEARRARLVLGELLIRAGKSAEAREPLMTLIQDYNDDKITSTDQEGLAMVGRAAHLMRKARDANDAYNQSERAGPKRVETLLWRAELFLDKYDPGHAEEVLKEALQLAPDNPDARVMLARVKLEQSMDFSAAEKAIARALAVNPRHPGAFAVRAGLALRDFDLAAADAAIDEGLKVDPIDLYLLSMRASTRLLADDRPGFDAARKKVLALNSEYSTIYQIIGEFADWEHRYDEIIQLMQEAVKVDPRDGKAWAVLGLNLIRVGDDKGAHDALQKSWSFDKFNVRVYNTLDLLEKHIPRFYETVDTPHFRYRYDKEERALLERYMPQMLEESYASMVKRYGFTPTTPIGLEMYSSREHFSVRTSGLPNIGIQGVCFGKTLAAISPKAEPFNWGNVVWHELGHVFAIQQSKAHVPRWFTEGLSEWETFIRRPEWQREEDMALYVALRAGRIPKVANFNRAFTHADDVGDVTMAYYAASQIVTFIAEKWGMPKIAEMLTVWGQGVRDADVIKRVLGIDADTLDKQFKVWLEPRLVRYKNQFVPDLRSPPLEEAEKAAKESPQDARKQVELCLAAAEEGDKEKAMAALDQAAKLAPQDPQVRFVQAKFAMAKKNPAEARRLLETMIREKQDGYSIRMILADMAESGGDAKTTRAHLEAARRFDPVQVEPIQGLYDLAKKDKKVDDQIAALRELSVLDQHDRRVYHRLMELLAEAERWDEVARIGARAVFVDVASPIVHRLYGKALAKLGERDKALYEYESAVLSDPEGKGVAELHLEMARLYKAMGQADKAKASAAKVLQIDPKNTEAQGLAK